MDLFRHLFGLNQKDPPELLSAIERAVSLVEPQLKHSSQYPKAFRKPVRTALDYAHNLAYSVPGPIAVNLDSYAHDAYVHAIFPSMDHVSDAFRASHAIQDYLRENPATDEIYALMGMRRREKATMGIELSGEVIQRDVPQNVVYFISHTVVDPAPSERQSRERVAWGFFNNLVRKVTERMAQRKQELQSQQQEMDLLMARLHAADAQSRPALQKELSRMLSSLHALTRSLDLSNYLDDFKDVLLNPEQHLRLDQFPMILDSMGIKREAGENNQGKPIIFNDLIGFDRRDWTVTMVHCHRIRDYKTDYLEEATRYLQKL